MSKEKEALDEFGKFLMQSVRDESIDVWNMILEGKMKGENAERIREFLGRKDNDVVSKIKRLSPALVDYVLHYLLWSLEQNDNIDIVVTLEDGTSVENLSQVSDGFPGELYGEYGWIALYSKRDVF